MIDPIEQLRSLAPEPDDTWATTTAGLDVLQRAIALGESDDTLVKPPNPRRRRRIWSGAIAFVLVASGTAATAYFGYRTPDHPYAVACYSEFSESPPVILVLQNPDVVTDPKAACREQMRLAGETFATTNLVLCVNKDGGAGVFPAKVGLSEQDACPLLGDWLPEDPQP